MGKVDGDGFDDRIFDDRMMREMAEGSLRGVREIEAALGQLNERRRRERRGEAIRVAWGSANKELSDAIRAMGGQQGLIEYMGLDVELDITGTAKAGGCVRFFAALPQAVPLQQLSAGTLRHVIEPVPALATVDLVVADEDNEDDRDTWPAVLLIGVSAVLPMGGINGEALETALLDVCSRYCQVVDKLEEDEAGER